MFVHVNIDFVHGVYVRNGRHKLLDIRSVISTVEEW